MVDLSQASSLKESTNIMVSSTIKPHTNAHSVCGRPTENVLEHFMKGSLRGLYERSIYERTFLSEPIENHDISNALSKVKRVKKHLNKHYRVFRRDRELRFHHVDFLVFKTGYFTNEAQVHGDMRLVKYSIMGEPIETPTGAQIGKTFLFSLCTGIIGYTNPWNIMSNAKIQSNLKKANAETSTKYKD